VTKAATSRADLPALLQRALELAIDAKAVGPVVLHLTEVAGYTDYALIVSGRSDRHVGGISEAIMTGLKAQGVAPIGSDGLDEHLWDLLDYDDFLVHVFYHPVRKHYDLESMWNDAPRVELGLPADVMDTSGLDELAPPDPMPAFRGGSFGAFEGELDSDDPDLVGAPGELPAVVDDGTNEIADEDDDEYTDDELDDYEDDADDLDDVDADDDELAALDGDEDDGAPGAPDAVDAAVAAEPARPARRK
jgi:ribosome silencing factor RsfS/YbeB/iojap